MKATNRLIQWALNPIVIVIYACLIVLAYFYADQPIARYFFEMNSHQSFFWMIYLGALGKWTAYFVIFLILALHFRYLRPNPVWESRCWFLFFSILIPNLICLFLKISLARARPELLFSQDLYGFCWFKLNKVYWSFPSGHATTITSLFVALSMLFYRWFWPLLVLCFLVIACRVVLYDHFLSDVMTGFYLTLLELGIFYRICKARGWFSKQIQN